LDGAGRSCGVLKIQTRAVLEIFDLVEAEIPDILAIIQRCYNAEVSEGLQITKSPPILKIGGKKGSFVCMDEVLLRSFSGEYEAENINCRRF
jgi:hypothetical protein